MKNFKDIEEHEKCISLLYTNDGHRGPGMVVRNLKKGLDTIGIKSYQVFHSKYTHYSGILQFCYEDLITEYAKSKTRALLGPNLFVLPTDMPGLCKSFDNFVVPSQWVKDLYLKFDLMKNKNIAVWPVGIDTEEWSTVPQFYIDEKGNEPDCFIYFKNRSEQDLAIAEAICKKFKLSYRVIKYGSYKEEELKKLCWMSKFAILLTGTESQGIGYMQILSTGTPCYVFDCSTWESEDKSISIEATSVPYWDESCGVIAKNVNLEHFKDFLLAVESNKFDPSKYILENHTLEKSAKVYYNLLRVSHGDETIEF